MFDFFRLLFDTNGFPARWDCGEAWTPALGWLHIVSDVLIWGAYTAIPIVLGYFVIRRRDVPFPKIFWLFVAFIFACGTGHLIEATIFWQPWYRLSGLTKVLIAGVSWATVLALIPIMPVAMSLRTPTELEREVEERVRSLRESEERRAIMMHELDHRVKNNIASIASIAEQTAASAPSIESFRATFLGRLHAMAHVHETLSASSWTGASLRSILLRTLEPYQDGSEHRVHIEGEDILVNSRGATALGMAIHELATNSVKYGSLSEPAGRLSVKWTSDEQGLSIEWVESGGPEVAPPGKVGFGSTLVRGVIEHELNGDVKMVYAPTGFECTIWIGANAYQV